MDFDPTPLNIFYRVSPESLDRDEDACDGNDDDDEDLHCDEDNDHEDDTGAIYEVEKKRSVVLPIRRSARLAERRLRLQQMLHDQENNDTTSTNTCTVMQADVLGSTFVNGRRRSARHLTSTNTTCSGL
jgi:U3 small nucleolar ribonucleoprotein component